MPAGQEALIHRAVELGEVPGAGGDDAAAEDCELAGGNGVAEVGEVVVWEGRRFTAVEMEWRRVARGRVEAVELEGGELAVEE